MIYHRHAQGRSDKNIAAQAKEDAFAKSIEMAKQKFRHTRLSGFLGVKAYIWYVEVLKNRCNAGGRTFCDAIKDPRFVGGDLPGFFGVLHTWGRQLQFHPHIHYVVTGGAISSGTGQWMPSRNSFYLPVEALSPIVQAKFLERIKKAGRLGEIPTSVWKTPWNVNGQAVGDVEGALKYLAPYVFRVAISSSRIVSVKNGQVTFSCRKKGRSELRTREVSVRLFL